MTQRRAWIGLAFVGILGVVGCDATTVGEPIGEERLGSEGTGAGGSGTGADGSGSSGATTGGGVEGAMMTDAEAHAWCQTYVFERHPLAATYPPPEPGTEVGGIVVDYQAIGCWLRDPSHFLWLWRPTVEDCVRNIRRVPCAASVAALDQCVDGIILGFSQENCLQAGECDAFFASQCDEVVVHTWFDGDGGHNGGFEVE